MAVLRRISRPLLATPFVIEGVRALRKPLPLATGAESWARRLGARIDDPPHVVRLNAAVQIGAGGLLALGRLPRTASLVLAAGLVPATLAEHAWWKEEDPGLRKDQLLEFVQRIGLFGALLLSAADTHGKPSAAYRARTVTARGRKKAHRATAKAGGHVHAAIDTVGSGASAAASGTGRAMHSAAGSARAKLPHR
ncbi:DoxX family protein [Streptomyces sp. NBC_00338]|uniref:DoxX family protein n=1 Tax=Streptomyces sp. NBC_00338 TaxID=2975715 RepID=UPI002259EB68|nr:DoxX family membrane protein [Streptomyces sp. NBC_00338]MCX5144583.1 DoxX family membrane protein [Streptomyces sp. NBC_00338]